MSWKFLFATVLATPLASNASTEACRPLEVQSHYRDLDKNHSDDQLNIVQGTASVVAIGKRFFALTASHVSAGENLQIRRSGRSLKTGKRYRDVLLDIELIELLEAPIRRPLVTFDESTRLFKISRECLAERDYVAALPNGRDSVFRFEIPTPSENIYGEYLSYVPLSPGMSGAALVGRNGYLLGVALGYHRYFSESYFATYADIESLLRQVMTDSPNDAGFEWRFRSGTTYRENAAGDSEIYSLSLQSGNGTAADGGDMSQKARFSTSVAPLKNNHAPMMRWKGQPILGFELIVPGRGNTGIAFYAEIRALKLIEELKNSGMEVRPIAANESLGEILRRRLGRSDLEHVVLPGALSIMNSPDTLKIRAKPHSQISLKLVAQTGPLAFVEHINLRLNERGELLDENGDVPSPSGFQPVVEVVGTHGNRYWVDLRGLFFFFPFGSHRHESIGDFTIRLLSKGPAVIFAPVHERRSRPDAMHFAF